ncbi:hypothetical protein CVU37_05245 [candidate division BRC1 bacterium HGW-BRC1-1]|nr:MAG: hypothetical protein CVU37_05245 [candidate division BRC1 bacterium HGW-BRC1-1]
MIFNRLFLTLFGFSVCCFQPTAWASEASSPSIEAGNQSAEMMGTGDGRIHVIPSLSKPSVKNGEKLVVSAVVKSQDPVAKVEADLGGVARVELKAKPTAGLGALAGGGFAGVYEAEWTAAGLEEKIYDVALTVTDKKGHAFTERSLKFSDPAAGTSAPGTTAYPNGGMVQLGTLSAPGESDFLCAVVDASSGYAYFGTNTWPGRVVKIALGAGATAPTRVSAVTLNEGEDRLASAVIDASNGYAYFATEAYDDPGRVVKVALGTGANAPTRVGAVTLTTGERHLRCAVIDAPNGYAYFGTYTSPGRVVKVALGAGAAWPTRVGAVNLNPEEEGLQSAVIDAPNGYAYFGTYTSPARVVKVALGAGAATPTRVGVVTLEAGENNLWSAVIDASNGHAFFGTWSSPAHVVKIALGSGAAVPTRLGAVTLNAEENKLRSAVMDAPNGYAYFGADTGRVVKVALGAGADAPTRVDAVTLNAGEEALYSAVIDAPNGFAYFATDTNPGNVVKVALGAGVSAPARAGAVSLNGGEDEFSSAVIDVPNGYAYFGTNTDPGVVVKVALGAGAVAPRRVGALTLNADEMNLTCAVIDAPNGYAYFGSNQNFPYTIPSRVIKIALGDGDTSPTRVGAAILDTEEKSLNCAVIDAPGGYAYFGTRTEPGHIVKVALGAGAAAPARVGGLELNGGEDWLSCAVIDAPNGYAYFGTDPYTGFIPPLPPPSQVIKVALGAGAAAPTRVGAVNAGSGLESAVIDTSNGYAYFGNRNWPGDVVKVALGDGDTSPTWVSSLTLNPGENVLRSAVIDAPNGCAYFCTDPFYPPSSVVKVALGDGDSTPTRLGAITLDGGAYPRPPALIDPTNGIAYFVSNITPWRIPYISLSQKGFTKGTRFTMPETGIVDDLRLYSHGAAGNVRMALYDDAATRTLLWESGETSNTETNGFITVPVSSGTPSALTLPPGNYNLAWQVDTTSDVVSYAAGPLGSGFSVPWSFGSFPTEIGETSQTLTSDNWTGYLTYTHMSGVESWIKF